MITKQHSHYLKFLAQGHNSLLLSNSSFKQFNELIGQFDLSIQRAINEDEVDNLTLTLMQNSIDIVIIDFTQDMELAKKFQNRVKNYNDRIVVIGLLKKENITELVDTLDTLDGILFEDFSTQELKDKLFVNLSIFYTIKSITVRDMKIDSGNVKSSDELDNFFDTYEGSTLFVVDELIELNKQLKAGDLSAEILNDVSLKMKELAEIFSKNEDTADVVDVFSEFEQYLKTIDLSTITPSSLHAFNYLCAMIDDTNTYMMEMFVERVFRDVYIFQHSFENNLKFMIDVLASDNQGEDDSELEFF